jgi:hypothetical protein
VLLLWKRLGTTTGQPRSSRPHKLTERDCQVLKHVTRINHLSSVATLSIEFQTASRSNVSTITVHQAPHEMGFHGLVATHKTKITCAMPSVGWSSVKLATIGLWSSGYAYSGMMNQASPFGSPTVKSGFGRCQENVTCPNA